jgi:ribosome biogenesis GTPase A
MLESFHAKKREVTAGIAELVTMASRIGAKSLAAKVDTELVKKLEADRFHLVVVGEFNHGKTTFVNALLGSAVLPVGVTPTTAVIHHLEYGDKPSAAVVRESGERKELPIDDVRKFAVATEAGGSQAEGVRYLEVFLPSPILKERIVLVDTPGVNDLSLQRADITYNYIPKSDAVLFLLDAGQPLKESERIFLQEKLLGQSRNKIIFVVTKRDIWDESEEKEALAYIRNELDKLLKGAPLFAVSAERALAADPKSGMNELVEHLMKFLAEERGRILLDNALGQGVDIGRLLQKGVDARRRAVQMTVEDLARRIDVLEKDLAGQAKTVEQRRAFIREEVAAIRAWVRRDLDHFVDDVVKQVPALVDNAKTDEIKLHLGPFLERTFIEWAEKETKEIAQALETLAERTVALVREDANETAKRLSDKLGGDIKAPDVQVDTLGYDVGVVALMTVGVGVLFTNLLLGGGLLAAALPLAWYLRGRIENQTRERARELAPAAIREAAGKLGPKLEDMVTTFADRLDAWVVAAGEELHRELIEILKQARTEREAGADEVRASIETCDDQSKQLGRVEERLNDLRAALWAPSAKPGEPAAESVPDAPGVTS